LALKQGTFLFPPAFELESLPDATVSLILHVIEGENRRAHWYASLGMLFGTVCFQACLGSFSYSVMNGHPGAVGAVLGIGVITIVRRLIAAKL